MKVGIVGHAQRGQVLAVQRADARGRRGGQLPVHDDRAQRRGRAGRRRAPASRSPRRSAPRTSSTTRSTSTTSPGSSRGAHEGEGLGNQFLANIRETDAIVHVVRAHDDDNVVHPEGDVDPRARHRDDRDRADLRRPRAGRAPPRARRASRRAAATSRRSRRGGWLTRGHRGAAGGPPGAHGAGARRRARRAAQPAAADRQAGAVRRQRRRGRRRGAGGGRRARRGASARRRSRSPRASRPSCPSSTTRTRAPCARTWAIGESGLRRVVDGAFALLRPDRLLHRRRGQAGAVLAPARGLTAWHAAGEIHSDIQKGFVRAEVDRLGRARRRRRLRRRPRPRRAAARGPRLRHARRRRHHGQVHAVSELLSCPTRSRRSRGSRSGRRGGGRGRRPCRR